MGQRAHNRRHEGRAIRKQQRIIREGMKALPDVLASFTQMLETVIEGVAKVTTAMENFAEGIMDSLYGYDRNGAVLVHEKMRQSDYALVPLARRLPELTSSSHTSQIVLPQAAFGEPWHYEFPSADAEEPADPEV